MDGKQIATVLEVIDGDTIDVNVGTVFFGMCLSTNIRVRFAKIDAPEVHGQEAEMGLKTKEWLKERIQGQHIYLDLHGKDKYGRYLADVYTMNNEDVGQEMLQAGLVELYSAAHHNDGVLEK
ncbi:thermonuclease family protein [Bacillus cereus group sp. BceL300]|uniref:thermonuclease family protein n=1 Tax=Bacillus cereus group sp. BceL300 TaxID=3444985 RepID=UPI003F22B6E3